MQSRMFAGIPIARDWDQDEVLRGHSRPGAIQTGRAALDQRRYLYSEDKSKFENGSAAHLAMDVGD